MFSNEINTLLHKSLSEVPQVVCQKSLRHDRDDLVAMVFGGQSLAVVADTNTEYALGADVFRALKGRFRCRFVWLEGMPDADTQAVEFVRSRTSSCDALIAVGSGTVNDICKYAAFLDGKPYAIFPTAASMNGYCSANASIRERDYKTTVKAAMPKAVFCDMGVIASAPARLSKSGLGDSLARPTAQADWLLSHLLLGTPYNEVPFTLLEKVEPILFDNARGIAMGDAASIETLLHTLLLSGLGMTIAGGSYPASQGEHMIAHTYEMLMMGRVGAAAAHHELNTLHSEQINTLHGEEIGVTTLAMARLQETLLRHPPALQLTAFPADTIMAAFGNKIAKEAASAYAEKQQRLEMLHSGTIPGWDAIAGRIDSISLSPAAILAILKSAEAPHTPELLGWDTESYGIATTNARYLRNRFTFLDLQ